MVKQRRGVPPTSLLATDTSLPDGPVRPLVETGHYVLWTLSNTETKTKRLWGLRPVESCDQREK